jgi:hypothetical protein
MCRKIARPPKALPKLLRVQWLSRCQGQDTALAVVVVAAMTAVGEPRADFPQIAHADGLTAQHTERVRAGRSAIHQDESEMATSRRHAA